ncbi:MAG TPA: VapC toxin family PIN domain ribonuclease [Lentisphaeria bacterium]|nr:MAG: twitching motility protein PilT [Lentisphaerae bacterium GWF2_50_93]HCE43102.1 VapC toxin family PIN domain ribonuclease [Lentisphaeria bacterium]
MKGKYFIDTNIILYSFDSRYPKKQSDATKIISSAITDGMGVISYQVIQEFCNVATSKFSSKMNISDCRLYIHDFLEPICEIYPSIELFMEALSIREEASLGFYDALIVASSVRASCRILLSEDMNHGQEIRGVKILNPFR